MKKLNVFANATEVAEYAFENRLCYGDCRKAQVYYLYHVECLKRSVIADITGYAVSSLSTMRNKVFAYAELAEMIFAPAPVVVSREEIIADVVMQTVAHTKIRRCGSLDVPMNYLENCGEDVEGQQTAYLFKFYTTDRTVPVFSKIGTTARSVNERLRREIGDYRKKFDIRSVDVCKIYNCGDLPAESFESYLRALLIKDYPNTWKKNDRFFSVDVSTDRFVTLCNQFAAL